MVCLNHQGKSQTGAMMTNLVMKLRSMHSIEALHNLLLKKFSSNFLVYRTILHGDDTHISQLHLQNLYVDVKLHPGRRSMHSAAT